MSNIGDIIEYTSENGYVGRMYGKSTLSVYKDGREVLHTYQRACNTMEELIEVVETMPEFMEILASGR